MNAHDLFQQKIIPLVYQQMQASCYDEAIAAIDDFYRSNVNKDHLYWLKPKSDAWKALILEKQSKYAEALLLYKSAYQSLPLQDNFYVYNRLNIARVLHKLKRNQEAIAEIEAILNLEFDTSVFELLALLDCYVDCLDSRNEIFPQKYLKFVICIAKELAIEFEPNLVTQINPAIKQMVQKNRLANRAYSLLLIQLNKLKPEEQIYLLRNYLSTAKIDYYRQMAIAQLKQIES